MCDQVTDTILSDGKRLVGDQIIYSEEMDIITDSKKFSTVNDRVFLLFARMSKVYSSMSTASNVFVPSDVEHSSFILLN